MPSTDADICNIALGKLGSEDEIGSIDSPRTTRERLFSRLFPHHRDAELRKRRWHFALAYAVVEPALPLSGDPDNPYVFPLPAECLRVLHPPHSGSTWYAREWLLRGNALWAAEPAAIGLNYIRRVPTGEFDATFTEALACKLAMEACEKITQSNQKKADLATAYKEAITDARMANAWETLSEDNSTNDFDVDFIAGRLVPASAQYGR